MNNLGLYIHVPFCKSKCLYCDFMTMPYQEKRIDEYFELLEKEISLYKKEVDNYIVDSIYIGGGTPSYVDSKFIVRINELLKYIFKIDDNLEYTIEVNPGTIDNVKLKDYKQIGINRISLGVQSFDNEILKLLGRNHNIDTCIKDFKLLREFGFKNISMDLMMGLPNQKINHLRQDLKYIEKLNPEHISWYSLIIEENTRFNKLLKEEKIALPEEEIDRKFYSEIIKGLNRLELNQYEISNFSKKGYESRHNLKYWNTKEYIGFGIAASGYTDGSRYTNNHRYKEYKKDLNNNKKPIMIKEKLETKDKIFEKIIMNMRLRAGLDTKILKREFDYDIFELNYELIKNYEKLDLIKLENNNIAFTENGFNISNKFFVDIVI